MSCRVCQFIPCLCCAEEPNPRCPVCLFQPCLCGDLSPPQPATSPAISVAKVAKAPLSAVLKPHQKEGVAFLTEQLSLNRGAILADYMGLGKTLQVITTLHHFLSVGSARTAMVLCPSICIENWRAEFEKWLSPESLSRYNVYSIDYIKTENAMEDRLQILSNWQEKGGVLLIGYEMYRNLLNPPATNLLNPQLQCISRLSHSTFEVSDRKKKMQLSLLEQVMYHLCNPGPDLLVLDEGHRIKDQNSLLSLSLQKIQTNKRLILTGYPLQNCLSEYWSMVNFAREGVLSSYDEFRREFEVPIMSGCSTKMNELVDRLKNVVLRRDETLLIESLPPKREYIISCRLTSIQMELYRAFLSHYENKGGVMEKASSSCMKLDLFTAYTTLLSIINHPDLVLHRLEQEGSSINSNMSAAKPQWEAVYDSAQKLKSKKNSSRDNNRKYNQGSILWLKELLKQNEANNFLQKSSHIEASGKMTIFMSLLKECLGCGDKMVVFSQSVTTLLKIAELLRDNKIDEDVKQLNQKRRKNNPTCFKKRRKLHKRKYSPRSVVLNSLDDDITKRKNVTLEEDILKNPIAGLNQYFLQIDGNTSSAKRLQYIKCFNEKSSPNPVGLFLVSSRAGAEGINLHAANRVVLFDVSWNPSHDHQAMCRSHRIGQEKPVHIYRLVSDGTIEQKVYQQQLEKVTLSRRVLNDENALAVTNQKKEKKERFLELTPKCSSSNILPTAALTNLVSHDVVLHQALQNTITSVVDCDVICQSNQ